MNRDEAVERAAGVMRGQLGSHHLVEFRADGWGVEHTLACRLAGALLTCEYVRAIQAVADAPHPEQFGTWRIDAIDSEGLPSLTRTSEYSQPTDEHSLIDEVLVASGYPAALEAAEQRAETLAAALDDVLTSFASSHPTVLDRALDHASVVLADDAALADRERTP